MQKLKEELNKLKGGYLQNFKWDIKRHKITFAVAHSENGYHAKVSFVEIQEISGFVTYPKSSKNNALLAPEKKRKILELRYQTTKEEIYLGGLFIMMRFDYNICVFLPFKVLYIEAESILINKQFFPLEKNKLPDLLRGQPIKMVDEKDRRLFFVCGVGQQIGLQRFADHIEWEVFTNELGQLYQLKYAFRYHPLRLMVGLLLLQDMYRLPPQQILATWNKRKDWQYFCGYSDDHKTCPVILEELLSFSQLIKENNINIYSLITMKTIEHEEKDM